MAIHFYDHRGEPAAYSEDDVHIYLFSGAPAAYIEGGSIFDYNGGHLGWSEDGWVVGSEGKSVFFTETAEGGIPRPLKRMPPQKNMKLPLPMKKTRVLKPLKPMRSASWLTARGIAFFPKYTSHAAEHQHSK